MVNRSVDLPVLRRVNNPLVHNNPLAELHPDQQTDHPRRWGWREDHRVGILRREVLDDRELLVDVYNAPLENKRALERCRFPEPDFVWENNYFT